MKRVKPHDRWIAVYGNRHTEGKPVPCACCWFVQDLSKADGMCPMCKKLKCSTKIGTPCKMDLNDGLMFEFLTNAAIEEGKKRKVNATTKRTRNNS